jgi:AraC-like DNA-binding protein
MITALEVFSDMSERLDYNLPGFPLYAKKGELCHFHQFATACHWHPDLEFIFVLNGDMEYFVNGQIIYLEKGEGIFINSKRLHHNYSKNFSNCTFLVVVVHPSILGTDTHLGKEYFELKFGIETEDYCLLKDDISWQKEALTQVTAIYNEVNRKNHNPLRLLSQTTSLCACISENIQKVKSQGSDEPSWLILWNMTGFIQKNYAYSISLDDIAAAGSICRSRCCQFFSRYVGQSPNTYLTRYRISKSCEMLRQSNMAIVEIAMACGFQSSSYFTQVFKKEIGLTPKEYRKQ